MRSLRAKFSLLLVLVLSWNQGMSAQDLRVLVLDALSGKPQAKVKVE